MEPYSAEIPFSASLHLALNFPLLPVLHLFHLERVSNSKRTRFFFPAEPFEETDERPEANAQ